MDDQRADPESGGRSRQNLDWICCLLLVPVLSNLAMWVAMVVAFQQLEHSEWFTNNVFARLLPIGFVAAVIGIIYTGYLSLWRGRETWEVAACCFLSAIALFVNFFGVVAIMARIPRL